MRLILFVLALALFFAFAVGVNARAGLRDKNIPKQETNKSPPPPTPPLFKDEWNRYEWPDARRK
jgi:hypothetical protein